MILDVFVTQILIPNGQYSEITHLINASLLEEQVKTELIQSYTTKVRSICSTSQNSRSTHPGAESGEATARDAGDNQLQNHESKLGRLCLRIERVGVLVFLKSIIYQYSNTTTLIPQTRNISSQTGICFISLDLRVTYVTLWL